jgi:hypothetical protein
LAGIAVTAILLGLLFVPAFPEIDSPIPAAQAEVEGRAMLDQLLAAHGGLDAFERAPALEVRFDDRWTRLLEAFSIWPGYSAEVEGLFAPDRKSPLRYLSRLSFHDGSLWAYDGNRAWVVEEGVLRFDSPTLPRARYASWSVPRLLFLPFTVVHEGAAIRAVHRADATTAFDVLEAEFVRPNTHGHKDRWLLFIDPREHLLKEVVFESTASDPPLIERCVLDGLVRVAGMVLAKELRCVTPTRLPVDLRSLVVSRHRALDRLEAAFEPPASTH